MEDLQKEDISQMQERILQGFFQATNSRDFSYIPKLYATNAIIHTLSGKQYGTEPILKIFQDWYTSFPDLELEIVQAFSPKTLSPEETKKIVEQAILDSGAKTKKNLGLVMKIIKTLGNTVDGKLAKDFNLSKITHHPSIIVQGSLDTVCPIEQASLLHKNWQNSELQIIEGAGHSCKEPAIIKDLEEATKTFISKYHPINRSQSQFTEAFELPLQGR